MNMKLNTILISALIAASSSAIADRITEITGNGVSTSGDTRYSLLQARLASNPNQVVDIVNHDPAIGAAIAFHNANYDISMVTSGSTFLNMSAVSSSVPSSNRIEALIFTSGTLGTYSMFNNTDSGLYFSSHLGAMFADALMTGETLNLIKGSLSIYNAITNKLETVDNVVVFATSNG